MKRFTTILWDLDGTLLDFLYSERISLKRTFKEFLEMEVDDALVERYSEINDSFWKKLELGQITKKELYTARFKALFEEMSLENADVSAFAAGYEEILRSVYACMEGALEICKRLHGSYRQYVITNGDAVTQRYKISHSGLGEYLDGVFISDEIGVSKPSPAFFDVCLEMLTEKDKNRVLIVGDSLSSDIKGGCLSGISTCWFAKTDSVNESAYREDFRISKLEDLMTILGEENG